MQNRKSYITILSLLLIALLRDEAISLWMRLVGGKVFNLVTSCLCNDVVVIALTIVNCVCCFKVRHKCWSWQVIGMAVISVLEIYARFTQPELFTMSSIVKCIAYADVTVLHAAVYCLTSFIKDKKDNGIAIGLQAKEHKATNYQADSVEVEDVLDRKPIAQLMASKIRDEYCGTDSAVGIAVTGEWGTGKSTFLNFLRKELKDCLIVDYDPWTEGSENIRQDLFDKIMSRLGTEQPDLSKILSLYIKSVNVTNVTGWFSLSVLAVKQMFGMTECKKQIKDELKARLKALDKPIVVFIDDSDRLPGNGFYNIISLIRGIADLPNLVFIVAYDQKRAEALLESVGGENFMRKLFNIVHPLQPIDESIISTIVCNGVARIFKMDSDLLNKNRDKLHFNHVRLSDYLPTLREVKRYLNLIDKDLTLIVNSVYGEDINPSQWLLLELLKFTDSFNYSLLYTKPDTYLNLTKGFSFNELYYAPKEGYDTGNELTNHLIDILFTKPTINSDPFDISSKAYFKLYFEDVKPEGYITHDELTQCVVDGEIDAKLFGEHIEECFAEGRTKNLSSHLVKLLKNTPLPKMMPLLEMYAKSYFAHSRDGVRLADLWKHSAYHQYHRLVQVHPFLTCLAATGIDHLCMDDKHKPFQKDMEQYCRDTNIPLLLAAMANQNMLEWDYDGCLDIDYYELIAITNLAEKKKYNDLVWAVGECSSPYLPEKFLKPFLEIEFLSVLPVTLMKVEYSDIQYIMIDIEALEALFITGCNFRQTIKKWKTEGRYDVEMLKEYESLANQTMLKSEHDERFLLENYPILSTFLSSNERVGPPSTIKIDSRFWEDVSRLHERIG